MPGMEHRSLSDVSVNSFRFWKGKAVLKKTQDRPKTTSTVPQKDGSNAPIDLSEPTEAKKDPWD